MRDDGKGGQTIKTKCGADICFQLVNKATGNAVKASDVKVKVSHKVHSKQWVKWSRSGRNFISTHRSRGSLYGKARLLAKYFQGAKELLPRQGSWNSSSRGKSSCTTSMPVVKDWCKGGSRSLGKDGAAAAVWWNRDETLGSCSSRQGSSVVPEAEASA